MSSYVRVLVVVVIKGNLTRSTKKKITEQIGKKYKTLKREQEYKKTINIKKTKIIMKSL